MTQSAGGHRGVDRPTFYPPKPAAWARVAADVAVLPALRRFWLHVDRVVLPPDDADRLAQARLGAAMLCPNHPSLHEPVVVYEAARRAGLRPYWVMARETMVELGYWRHFAQRLGVYTIRRGMLDRAAFQTTRDLLRDQRAVVVFPEGVTYGLNDTTIPFQDGVAQLGFWGLQDARKAGVTASLKLLPMAVKYRYQGDVAAVIDQSLGRLEAALELAPPARSDRLSRLAALGLAILERIERELDLPASDGRHFDRRIARAMRQLAERCAARLDVRLPEPVSGTDPLHHLLTVAWELLGDERVGADPPAPVELRRDLDRLQVFRAVRAEYVARHPSAERFLDVISRLELEVFGETRVHTTRVALVRVGQAIDLSAHLRAYEADRRAAVATVTGLLQRRVQAMLSELSRGTPALAD